MHGWELSNEDYNVAVKSFSSRKLEDMKDYLKPLFRRKPDEIMVQTILKMQMWNPRTWLKELYF